MSGLPVDLVPTHDETRRLETPEGHEATEEQVAACAIATKPEQVLRGMRQRDGRGTFPQKLVVPPYPNSLCQWLLVWHPQFTNHTQAEVAGPGASPAW